MVEIGGEIRARGQRQLGRDWDLAIETPSFEPGELVTRVRVSGKGLTTSGDYRAYFEKGGQRFSHTIDPRTGAPVTHNLASISVVAASAAEADGWDTALMVLGPEAGRRLAREQKIAAFMILRQGSGFVTEAIGGFETCLVKP
jgi:thiamine biosynthesis lipoprotein